MKWESFRRWFNRDFWRAFRNRTFPIELPENRKQKDDVLRRVFESIRTGRYSPSIPEAEIVTNKGYGVARTTPVFCIEDYIVYYFCIKELKHVISGNRVINTFGGWTLGGNIRRREQQDIDEPELGDTYSIPRYAFNPRAWTNAFGEFNSLLFAQIETQSHNHVLQFDLSNFYDCIRLDILERWIREDSPPSLGWIIALLFYFLNQWNRRNTGLHPQGVGIPQDALADCSRLLANYYLQRYDSYAYKVCLDIEAVYFRYADDQMVLLNDTTCVDPLMLLLTRNLDRYGLRVNQKKVDLWTTHDLEQHRCRHIQSIFANKGDNKDPVLVEKFIDEYLKLTKPELSNTWNKGLPLLNRLLWAEVGSVAGHKIDILLDRYLEDDYLTKADRNKLMRLNRLVNSRGRNTDFRDRLINLCDNLSHNTFHYEVIGFAREIKDKALEIQCKTRIEQIEKLMQFSTLATDGDDYQGS